MGGTGSLAHALVSVHACVRVIFFTALPPSFPPSLHLSRSAVSPRCSSLERAAAPSPATVSTARPLALAQPSYDPGTDDELGAPPLLLGGRSILLFLRDY